MALIIPYSKEIANSDGGFITPGGEFISTGISCHEGEAKDICIGRHYNFLNDFLYRKKNNEEISSGEIDYIKKLTGLDNIDELDKFSSSKLTKEELEMYKKWVNLVYYGDEFEVFSDEKCSGFLHRFLRYDKLETIRRRTITTTNPFLYTRFFEWMIMGWNIEQVCLFKFNDNGEVEVIDPADEKLPGWVGNLERELVYRDKIWNIKQQNWDYEKRVKYLKRYKDEIKF